MTEDYKNLTLDYITRNLDIENMNNNSFRNTSNYTNNFTTICENEYGFTPSTIMYLTTDTTSNFIIYGTYDDNGTYRGYIAVLNQKGDIETIFTAFDSGTQFSYIYTLKYDENGNIYGIDENNNKARIILLNNVALKTSSGYSCRLRSSYYLPTQYQSIEAGLDLDNPGLIKKAYGKATYYLFGEISLGHTYQPTLLKFVINVGSSNEWVAYTGNPSLDTIELADTYIEPGEEEDKVVCLMMYQATGINEFILENGTFSLVNSYEMPLEATSIETGRLVSEGKFFVATRNSSYTSSIYYYDNYYQLINSKTFANANYRRSLCLKNGILFDKLKYYGTSNNLYVGSYDGGDYISEEVAYVSKNSPLEVVNNYGLYELLIQDTNNLVKPNIVIYSISYSGESYINYNSLVALHGELYSNGSIVFARNLYNKQFYSNITTSTLNVPNNFLNDIPIQTKNLISATMTTLNSDTDEITKNIYENLFINFINKITVIDEETQTSYPNTASYINVGTNTGTQEDYEGSAITKIRLNFDNESVVKPIVWDDISTDTTIAKQTMFTIYVSSDLTSIDFISEDETFTYITKEYEGLQVGNYYTITQKIRIE